MPLVVRAMAVGSKPWNRSKVMIVGAGRVGKTALCNSMMGKPFIETESTVGLTQLTCDVRRVAASNNSLWTERTKPEREYEAGIAQLIRNMESREPERESHTEILSEAGIVSSQIQPDVDLVMRYLADANVSESNLILSLFDLGGQAEFNIIHHLFLTSYGVYIVVFNMVDILDDNKREQSLNEL